MKSLKKALTSISSHWAKPSMVVFLLLMATHAYPHMMPAQQGTINIVDKSAFVVLSLPVSGLQNTNNTIDSNGDGHLSAQELQLHQTIIEQQVAQRARLYDGKRAGKLDFIQISAEPDHQTPIANSTVNTTLGDSQFMVLMKISFETAPAALRMETDFFGVAASEQQFTIKAIRGKDTEAIILRAGHPEYHFFRSTAQVMLDFVVIGCEHILLGFDHLLFLLTIVVAAAGWCYWLGVITSFTIAHSITLTLSLLGLVNIPTQIIEPLIAASIVLMALLNLTQRKAAIPHRWVIVFSCGLLHGLGFASSIADIGLQGTNRLVSLLGFNLGIELGQGIFLISVLLLSFVLLQLKRFDIFARINLGYTKKLSSVVALTAGTFWMFERLLA